MKFRTLRFWVKSMFRDEISDVVDEGACSTTGPSSIKPLLRQRVDTFEAPTRSLRPNPVIARLTRLGSIGADGLALLESLTRNHRIQSSDQILFSEGANCDHVCFLIEGIACRYTMLPNGSRQILGYILPGDMCDLESLTIGALDHSVSLLTKALVAKVARTKMLGVLSEMPSLGQALDVAAMIEKAVLRQWLLNVGQRNASERLSHLLCEFAFRMEDIGYVDPDGSMPFEINQVALADTLGMTNVHVNRILKELRAANLIVLRKRRLTIVDSVKLTAIAEFEPRYLRPRRAVR